MHVLKAGETYLHARQTAANVCALPGPHKGAQVRLQAEADEFAHLRRHARHPVLPRYLPCLYKHTHDTPLMSLFRKRKIAKRLLPGAKGHRLIASHVKP